MLNTLPPLVTNVGRAEEFFGALKGRSSDQKNNSALINSVGTLVGDSGAVRSVRRGKKTPVVVCPNDSGNPFARPNGSITNGKESEQPLTVAKSSAIALVTE